MTRPRGTGVMAAVLMALTACGGDGTGPAPVATNLALVSGGNQTGAAGQPLAQPIVVRATTSSGAGVSGVSVTFAVTAGGGSVSATAVTTDAQGQATTTWTVGTAAAAVQTITATSAGLTGSPVTVNAAAVAGPAASLTVASGNNQTGAPGQPLTQLVVARVADQFANPVQGVPVQWQVTSGGGSVALPSTVTTAAGTASVAWTLGNAVGAQALQASVAGVATPLPFAATAINLVITSIAPDTLVEGQAGTITGEGFDPAPGATTVTVGGTAATITAIAPTSITFTVPSGDCRPSRDATVEVRVSGIAAFAGKPVRPAAFLSLAVGQQQILASPTDLCLQFERKAAAEGYLIGVQSVIESAASLTPVVFTSEVAPGAAPAPGPAPPGGRPPARSFGPEETARQRRWAAHRGSESRLRELERRTLPRPTRAPAEGAARASAIPPNLNVGDVIPIRVPTATNLCNFNEIQAVVRAIGTRGVWLEDQANPANGYSTANFQSLSAQLDNPIYDLDVAYFGAPTDLDANSRIAVVITKEVNKFQAVLGGVVLGFVTSADLMDRSQCASSDFGEIFYGIAPDPTGSFGSQYPVADALADAPFVIAHEFTHIIQFGVRQGSPAFLAQWESEGQATFAEEVVGHAVEGRAPGQNLGLGVAFNLDDNSATDWYSDGFVDLALHFGFESQTAKVANAPEQCSYLANPPTNAQPCLTGNRSVYGVPWSLLRWIADQFGPGFPGGEQALLRSMVSGTTAGFANLTRVTGEPIGTMLAQWAAMLYVDDRFPGMAQRLTLPSWNMFDIYEGTFMGSALFPSTRLVPRDRGFASYTDNISVRGGSSSYHRVSSTTRAATAIKIRGSGNATLPAGMQVWVVRVQ